MKILGDFKNYLQIKKGATQIFDTKHIAGTWLPDELQF